MSECLGCRVHVVESFSHLSWNLTPSLHINTNHFIYFIWRCEVCERNLWESTLFPQQSKCYTFACTKLILCRNKIFDRIEAMPVLIHKRAAAMYIYLILMHFLSLFQQTNKQTNVRIKMYLRSIRNNTSKNMPFLIKWLSCVCECKYLQIVIVTAQIDGGAPFHSVYKIPNLCERKRIFNNVLSFNARTSNASVWCV